VTDKITRQLQLETMASGLGVSRYHKDRPLPWRKDTSSTTEEADLATGKQLLRRVVPPLAAAIADFVETAGSGKAGRRHTAYAFLVDLDPEAIAYLAARRIVNALVKQDPLTRVAMAIATSIEDNIRLDEFAAGEHKGLLKSTLKQLKTSHARHRQNALRHALRVAEVDELNWSQGDRLATGTKLVELFCDVTGLAEIKITKQYAKTVYLITPTEQTMEWLTKVHEEQALLAPYCLPMIVPPRDWSNPINGGYLSEVVSRRVTLMRTRKKNTIDDLFSMDMPEVYSALNAIQRTAWAINSDVLDTARVVWEQGGGMAGIPDQSDEALPARPENIPADIALGDLAPADQKRLKQWKAEARDVYETNAKRVGQRIHVAQQLWTAGTFADEEEIFFPHNLDFRGRIYSVPTGVNPQGDDLSKGLLTFAHPQPLGETGGYWLAVHVANVWGVADKAALDDRVKWVAEHEALILDSADAPLDGRRFWTEADGGSNAWQALAAAKEWAAYVRSGRSSSFMSRLPVAMDGSCSGLQHFSAMLRDEVGGKAVNLTPSVVCNDIYTQVAGKVEEMLTEIDDNDLSKVWAGKVARGIVKQPCMTFAYSVTSRGMRDQIVSALKKADGTGNYLDGVEYFTAANFLAPIVERAIRQTVIAASSAMIWLQDGAALLADEGMPVHWTTPVGLPVRQDETTSTAERRNVWVNGQRVRVHLTVDTGKTDKRRQRSAIAPNVVHSLDAAHLMKTVNACTEEGIESFAMIHDSFGTHAGQIGAMNNLLRREFVVMYTPDVLDGIRDEILEQLSPEKRPDLAPVPPQGTLDLRGVLHSDFFFA
jgi:DNA-directed RNA polymerase